VKNQADLRRRLSEMLAAHSVATAEKAVSGNNIQEDMKQLEAYERLLAALPCSRLSETYPAMLIAAVCLLAASVAWAVRVPTTKVHLTVKSTTVSLRLTAPLAWQGRWPIGGSLIRLREFGKIELPPELGISQQLTQRAWLDIAGGTTQLTRLDIGQGTFVKLTCDESGHVDILTLNKSLSGQLDIAGRPNISAGRAPNSNIKVTNAFFDPPGTVTFYDPGRPANPSVFQASPLGTLQLLRVPVHELSLFTEMTNAQQESFFASGIIEGAITVSDSGAVQELKPGDPLYLEGASGVISALEIRPGGLGLIFDGETHGLSLGAPGFERNLKPTLLEYLYHREKLSFFWGGVTFLWGLIWSGRKLFFA
jgi:hypothetical protein